MSFRRLRELRRGTRPRPGRDEDDRWRPVTVRTDGPQREEGRARGWGAALRPGATGEEIHPLDPDRW